MHNSLNMTTVPLNVGDSDIGVSYYAVFDEDIDGYLIYTGADQMTADLVGQALTFVAAKYEARQHLASLYEG